MEEPNNENNYENMKNIDEKNNENIKEYIQEKNKDEIVINENQNYGENNKENNNVNIYVNNVQIEDNLEITENDKQK